ncbi:MAG: hypothetical protein QOE59_3418 [Actinomycetota bacterium]|nr:hypothetical protein [Actinomycetota bacterium]
MVAMPEVPEVRHRWHAVNGIRLHVAEAGPETAPAVVLLHGFPQHWYVWRALITSLATTHRVVALDLRGAGWSDAPRTGYSTDDRVRDVLAVLDEPAIPRADLVGHDWGGWLAFRMALDHPGRVRRLVAISTPTPGRSSGTWRPRPGGGGSPPCSRSPSSGTGSCETTPPSRRGC